MNRQTMLRRLGMGHEPIDVAIKKWEDIKNGIKRPWNDGGTLNCALCYKYLGKNENCKYCPIKLMSKETRKRGCVPYLGDADEMLKILHKTKDWIERQKRREGIT